MSESGKNYLPQINAPYEIIFDGLNDENIKYEKININPNKLIPSQAIVFSHEIEKFYKKNINPIFIDKDLNILDGHHRYIYCINTNQPIKAIKINLNTNDACRVLNKIQDIHEYSEQLKFEEDVNDTINNYNDKDNELSDYIVSLEEDNEADEHSNNQTKIIAYRKEPIKENSPVGNFFVLEPVKGYRKYEIEFDNLLDTDTLGLSYKDGQIPVDILAKTWFPHINFEKIAEKKGMDSIKIKNRAVAEKARKIGYDGIKYGKKLLQGI